MVILIKTNIFLFIIQFQITKPTKQKQWNKIHNVNSTSTERSWKFIRGENDATHQKRWTNFFYLFDTGFWLVLMHDKFQKGIRDDLLCCPYRLRCNCQLCLISWLPNGPVWKPFFTFSICEFQHVWH